MKQFDYSDATFLYECCDSTRNKRLMALLVGLKQLGWIDGRTMQQDFIDLFSGQPRYHRIRWTGSKQHLAYLFKQLVRVKQYVRTTYARIWQTVRSHFVQPNGHPFDADMHDQQVPGLRVQQQVSVLVEIMNPSSALPSAFGR